MKEIKKIKRHVYKNLPTYGFIGAICLIGGSIVYFNQLWTALGENPKIQLLPQVTKDYEEFKDHATLIIALIAATGSILSSLLIMLFYGAWKEQYNKTEDSKLAKELYLVLQEEKEILTKFKVIVEKTRSSETPIFTTLNAEEIENFIKYEIIEKSLFIKSNLIIFEDLTGDEEFSKKVNEHSSSFCEFSDYWHPIIKNTNSIKVHIEKNNELFKSHEQCIINLQKILKEYIKIK